MPSGAIHNTISISAPKNSKRYSASPASASGSSTTMAAPTSGPVTVPAPPTITTSTNRIDCINAKLDGVTNPDSGANSAPASPAQAADKVNASALTATGLSPIDSAAISESFTARIDEPHDDRASRENPKSTSAHSAIDSRATPRSPNALLESCTVGTLMMPFWPPVRPRHSAVAFSMTKPNAIVTIARYGPRTRNAGSASSAPTSADRRIAAGSASQNEILAVVVRIATGYAPIA